MELKFTPKPKNVFLFATESYSAIRKRKKRGTCMKCHNCGKEMEEGSLRAIKAGRVALFWGQRNKSFFNAGEKIKGSWIHVEIDGFRCLNCKTLLLNYGENTTLTEYNKRLDIYYA